MARTQSSTILKHKDKPALLVLTSSFPSSPDDETCGYIRDLARSLSAEFSVTVLAPPDERATDWPDDVFRLSRSRSMIPLALDPFQASYDLNVLASGSVRAKLATLISVACFFVHAFVLAFRADAICSHWLVPSGLAGALVGRLFRKPHIVVEHSGALHLLRRMQVGKRIARLVIKSSHQAITVSHDLECKLIALCPEAEHRVCVIPMGVNIVPTLRRAPSNDQQREGSPSILFIGRLTEIKGVDVLLHAVAGLNKVAQLIVAGDGERRHELETLARALHLNVRFIGRINALQRSSLLDACDIVVIPSRALPDGRTEGTPVVCLEAMAAGRAIIASRVGGLAEVILDDENGLLFENGDRRMLEKRLISLAEDEYLRLRVGECARRSAEAYEWTRIGSRFAAVIKSALRENDVIGNRRIAARRITG